MPVSRWMRLVAAALKRDEGGGNTRRTDLTQHQSISLRTGVVIAAMLMISALGAAPALADNTQFSGQATGVQATVLGLQPITLSDTGPLPPLHEVRFRAIGFEHASGGVVTSDNTHKSPVALQ